MPFRFGKVAMAGTKGKYEEQQAGACNSYHYSATEHQQI
jgi:hypothetical protein